MGEKIVVGPVNKGLRTDRLPFVIDNDSFPTLINAYHWRGRVKRKRGTAYLGRLNRFFNSTITSYNSGSSAITLDGSGNGNLITGFSLQTNASLVPGTVIVHGVVSGNNYEDLVNGNGILYESSSPAGTVNYATGAFNIPSEAGNNVTGFFNYYPDLPVMGLEDLILGGNQFPGTMAFDTTYSYNISTMSPYSIQDVSFYKNLASGTYPGYIQKTNWTPTKWNGQNYQQFWTTNYQGALWATNGIDIPFTGSTIGMQFKNITGVTVVTGGPPATATLTIVAHGLVVGDFIFVNEVGGNTGINFQTGYVIAVPTANTVTVEFPNATLAGAYTSGGIAQYLTSVANPAIDCLRWYDGAPINSSFAFVTGNGWVNFAPPLSRLNYSIDEETPAQYYLVGARIILPFKDRLLFFGPVIQTSSGSPIYLQDTVIYSQNGTPYYTASFTGDPSLSTTVFTPILVPGTEVATPTAFWEDQTGFGGFVAAGIDQMITTAAPNEDVLIVGFERLQTRLVYSGNDIIPFNFYSINSELGSGSTFSVITLDKGVITKGSRGYVITSQISSQRIDLEIPDQVFEVNLSNNGTERVTAQRDFINEWIYITYPSNEVTYNFPNQTLQYNYRDVSWAIFNETYTTYGQFRAASGNTWATIGNTYSSWSVWNSPWNSGSSTLFNPKVIAGNQQGFVVFRDEGTSEATSLYIQGISGSTITSPNHCLNEGDYIIISGVQGTIGTQVNGKIFSVVTPTTNTFLLNPSIGSGTYTGVGLITRMYVPYVQTKQFPVAWGMARKTRIGPQQYLLSTTAQSQIQLLIFLSQNDEFAYNTGTIVPDPASINNSLIYSTILYTCPESTNLGLTPANTNLQMIVEPLTGVSPQQQIWHRVNTSLIGDTVQLGFTMSDTQMRAVDGSGNPISQFSEIELHGFIIDVSPSGILA